MDNWCLVNMVKEQVYCTYGLSSWLTDGLIIFGVVVIVGLVAGLLEGKK